MQRNALFAQATRQELIDTLWNVNIIHQTQIVLTSEN